MRARQATEILKMAKEKGESIPLGLQFTEADLEYVGYDINGVPMDSRMQAAIKHVSVIFTAQARIDRQNFECIRFLTVRQAASPYISRRYRPFSTVQINQGWIWQCGCELQLFEPNSSSQFN